MGDVPQAQVRVLPGRLRQLKKVISDCDRRIQVIDLQIFQANCNIEMAGTIQALHRPEWRRWVAIKEKAIAKRQKLDAKRKAARLEAKGYSKHKKSTR